MKSSNKRIPWLILCLMAIYTLIFSGTHAQITIDSTDMPFPGDIVNLSTGLNIDFIDYTETGEDFVWDFSELLPVFQVTDTFVSPSQTPFTYQFFFMGRTNLAYRYIQDLPLPDFEFSNVFFYYKNKQSRFENAGYAASLNALPLPIVLSSPDVLYNFPLQYGRQDSSASGLIYNLPDIAYLEIDRKRKNNVDGWGTLITPYGTFEVLRIISEVVEYDSIYIDSLETGIPVNRRYTEYKWLAKGQKVPVLNITSESGGVIVTYADSVRSDFNSIDESSLKPTNLKVFPNPANSEIFVEYKTKKPGTGSLGIIDAAGRHWHTETENFDAGINRKIISLKNIPSGQYLVFIRLNSSIQVTKIIVKK